MTRWWRTFARSADAVARTFTGRGSMDVVGFMRRHLEPLDERLWWEFAPAPGRRGGHALVITAEGDRTLRPIVEDLVARAPRLQGWTILADRPALPPARVVEHIQAYTGVELVLDRARVRAGPDRRIDIVFGVREGIEVEPAVLRAQAMLLAGGLLGGRTFEVRVGEVGVDEEPAGRGIALDRLHPTVRALALGLDDQLPRRPLHTTALESRRYTIYGLAPPRRRDYGRQEDVRVAKTWVPDVFRCAHGEGPFFSTRFSRFGETFAYVKLDGRTARRRARLDGLEATVAALDAALLRARAGCVIGDAQGARYDYVDVALAETPLAVEIVTDVLRARKAPKRSWVLFHDDELHGEWVGVWDGTPEPPVRRH